MYYIIMYYISKLFEMRFCYTVVFTSNYAQIPRPIISVNSSFLKPVCKGRQTRNFFRVSSKFLGGHLYVREAN